MHPPFEWTKEALKILKSDQPVTEIARQLGVTRVTIHRKRAEIGHQRKKVAKGTRVQLILPDSLVKKIDLQTVNRSEWIRKAIEEKLSRKT